MLQVTVNLNDAGASGGIAALVRACQNRQELHEAMAAGVENLAADHLRGLNSRSPNTSFYGRAARSTESQADERGAEVIFTHRGIALRFYGGRVLPKNVRNLAIPTEHVPLAGTEGRRRPREMGVLAFLPRKKSAPDGTTGYLVEGMEITGKRSGKLRVVPKPGGRLLYVLRSWTDHAPDETVMPSIADLIRAGSQAASDYIDSIQ